MVALAEEARAEREIAACTELGGHWRWLDIDPADRATFGCSRCPARASEFHPGDPGLLYGEFEVYPGYVLSLEGGSVRVNGSWHDGLHEYGWRGPVTAEVQREPAHWEDSYDYESFIVLTPGPDRPEEVRATGPGWRVLTPLPDAPDTPRRRASSELEHRNGEKIDTGPAAGHGQGPGARRGVRVQAGSACQPPVLSTGSEPPSSSGASLPAS